jgi:signal transduction histidine kinase
VGLYVCRQIVERHGGRIEPGFPPDGGAAFTVTIPTGLDAIAAPPASSEPLRETTD